MDTKAPNPAAAHQHHVLGDARFRFFPLWEMQRNDIFCYLCEAFWDVGEDRLAVEAELAGEFDDAKRIRSLDFETLHRALASAEEVAGQYGVLKVLIPVHFETLADEASVAAYKSACNDRVWSVFDYVYFEITHPPENLTGQSISEAAAHISPFGQAVLLRTALNFDRFADIPGDVIAAIGVDSRTDLRPEAEVLADLTRFSAGARAATHSSYVHGLKTMTLSAAAVSAGFDYIGSDHIAPPLEKWEPDAGETHPADLLQKLLASKQEK